jgi:tetratricopeptide (TPR) repeat protein
LVLAWPVALPWALPMFLSLILGLTLTACSNTVKDEIPATGPAKTQSVCIDLLQTGENAFKKGDVQLANTCFSQALKEAEKLGKDDKNVALALNDLALTTALDKNKTGTVKKNLPLAIAYQKRSVEIEEKLYGHENDYVAYDLNNLGAWYNANGQYKEGEQVLLRAAKIREKVQAGKSLPLALTLANLGDNYIKQKRFSEAAGLLKRSSEIYLTNDHQANAAAAINSLAQAYQDQGKYKEAEASLEQVLSMREKAFGKDHIVVAEALNDKAVCLLKQGKNREAEPLFQEALSIAQKKGDKDIIASVVAGYGKCLDKLGKKAEAAKMRKGI